jgi:hypothetical protein
MKTFLTALCRITGPVSNDPIHNLPPPTTTTIATTSTITTTTTLSPRTQTHHMRVLDFLQNLNVVELDVEVLVDTLEDTTDLDIILELDRDLVVDEGFEEAAVW